MTQFLEGLLALPVGVTSVVIAGWVITHLWDQLDRWCRDHKPRQVSDVLFHNRETGQDHLRLSGRAPLLAALAVAPKLFTLRPLPGTFVVVVRDYRTSDPDEFTRVRAAARDALVDLSLPVNDDTRG